MYANYTEYLKHPKFREVCERVRRRSGGRCEGDIVMQHGPHRCGRNAMDFHHVRYCKWGQFDPPENLLHLCRECHEAAHTCQNCGGILKAEAIKAGRDICYSCYVQAIN